MSGEITQEIFIERCNTLHGNFYDYSKTVYKGMHEPIIITCPDHGDFTTRPVVHYHQKSKCPACTLSERREKVIKNKQDNLQKKHKGVYKITCWDNYETLRTVVPAECRDHGEYSTTVESIIRSDYGNCPRCKQLLEAEKFRKKADQLHKGKYIFDNEDYTCSRTKMKFLCTKHDHVFYQRPSAHLQNQGCPLCGTESSKDKMSGSYEEFLEKSQNIYGNKYSYSKEDYKNFTTPVTITCPVHGDFKSTPNNHFMGSGCTKCGTETRRLRNHEKFLSKMEGNPKYFHLDFSKVYYVNNREKVTVICKLHNKEFNISPNKLTDSTRTCGCNVCGKLSSNRWTLSSLNKIPNIRKKVGYFYSGKVTKLSGLKIGLTGDLKTREDIYRRDLVKYEGTHFNYLKVVEKDYYTCAVIETVIKKFFREKPYLHDLDFGGKNEMFDVTGHPLLEDIFNGRWDTLFDLLASKVTSAKDKEINEMVKILRGVYGD